MSRIFFCFLPFALGPFEESHGGDSQKAAVSRVITPLQTEGEKKKIITN